MATATSTGTGQLALALKDAQDAAVDAAYAQAGFVTKPDENGVGGGERDTDALRARIYAVVSAARVNSPGERKTKAITKGALAEAVFPSLPAENWENEDDPSLAEWTFNKVRGDVWTAATADVKGSVQQQVGLSSPDSALCQTQIGSDGTPAVYVTSDLACLKEDLAGPHTKAIRNAHKKMARNMAMLTGRQPEHAKTFERLLKEASKNGLEAGKLDMAPALEAAKPDGNDEEE